MNAFENGARKQRNVHTRRHRMKTITLCSITTVCFHVHSRAHACTCTGMWEKARELCNRIAPQFLGYVEQERKNAIGGGHASANTASGVHGHAPQPNMGGPARAGPTGGANAGDDLNEFAKRGQWDRCLQVPFVCVFLYVCGYIHAVCVHTHMYTYIRKTYVDRRGENEAGCEI
jgi:hypothetical protein